MVYDPFVLILVYGTRYGLHFFLFFFAYGYAIFILPFVGRLSFPPLNFLCTLAQNQLSINMWVYFLILFYSIDLVLCFDPITTFLTTLRELLILLGLNLQTYYLYLNCKCWFVFPHFCLLCMNWVYLMVSSYFLYWFITYKSLGCCSSS